MESGEERVDWKRNEVKRGFGLLGGLNWGLVIIVLKPDPVIDPVK